MNDEYDNEEFSIIADFSRDAPRTPDFEKLIYNVSEIEDPSNEFK